MGFTKEFERLQTSKGNDSKVFIPVKKYVEFFFDVSKGHFCGANDSWRYKLIIRHNALQQQKEKTYAPNGFASVNTLLNINLTFFFFIDFFWSQHCCRSVCSFDHNLLLDVHTPENFLRKVATFSCLAGESACYPCRYL